MRTRRFARCWTAGSSSETSVRDDAVRRRRGGRLRGVLGAARRGLPPVGDRMLGHPTRGDHCNLQVGRSPSSRQAHRDPTKHGSGIPLRPFGAAELDPYHDRRAGASVVHGNEGLAVKLCRPHALLDDPQRAGLKHLNRLSQVLARREWDAEYHDGLMADHGGRIVEGCTSNLFLVAGGDIADSQSERVRCSQHRTAKAPRQLECTGHPSGGDHGADPRNRSRGRGLLDELRLQDGTGWCSRRYVVPNGSDSLASAEISLSERVLLRSRGGRP